jgi:hypothetical protein
MMRLLAFPDRSRCALSPRLGLCFPFTPAVLINHLFPLHLPRLAHPPPGQGRAALPYGRLPRPRGKLITPSVPFHPVPVELRIRF